MFVGMVEEKTEYATIVTIAMAILFRNLAIFIGGPYIYTPLITPLPPILVHFL